MRHLFIINPAAARIKGNVSDIVGEIDAFFRGMGMDNYDIHVTRWARDGMGFANRYALSAAEPVRVHAVGGTGTLYEVINGVIGLPNVQIAVYPLGCNNPCVHYFGKNREHKFRSLRGQVFSGVTPIDALRCGNIYGICNALIGLEAVADRDGVELRQKISLPEDLCSLFSAAGAVLRSRDICQNYKVTIDGADYSGEYVSMLIAGVPCYGAGMAPAPSAHPNDGILDIYLIENIARARLLSKMSDYVNGRHENLSDWVKFVRGKTISVSADRDITLSLDGEIFYERGVSYEVVPGAIDLVCPDGIDIKKLPRVYNRPELGTVGEGAAS